MATPQSPRTLCAIKCNDKIKQNIMIKIETLKNYNDLFEPIINSLKKLGGSASNQELIEEVSTALNLTDDDLSFIAEGQTQPQFSLTMGWAKSFLKRAGYIDNTSRGIWSLTKLGNDIKQINKKEINKSARKESQRLNSGSEQNKSDNLTNNDSFSFDDSDNLKCGKWQDELLSILKTMNPSSFEKLCQRFLRECGFVQVDVTGKSGDGGIDGHGVLKIGSLLSFHVHFQAKRYNGSVTSPVIRDFRGAMAGRADKGLIITTGNYTKDAIKEAQRDGVAPIDLINGIELIEKLKELKLGIRVTQKVIEEVTIDKEWFDSI